MASYRDSGGDAGLSRHPRILEPPTAALSFLGACSVGGVSQIQQYAILLVVEPYLLEIVPLDGCNWIGDNDVGPNWSEMLKLTKKADYGPIALKHLAVNA